jgi:hypothetical protein
VAKVYWTTLSGIETRVDVTVPGERPIQMNITKAAGQNETDHVTGSIGPACRVRIRIAAENKNLKEEGVAAVTAQGQGTVSVRVHGWTKGDFAKPPTISVRYFKGDQLVGQTSVEAKPIPSKLAERTDRPKDVQERLSRARKTLLAEYKGKEVVPDRLLDAYASFVSAAKKGSVDNRTHLPHSLTLTHQPRLEKTREYGQDVNIPFLRKHFDARVLLVRKDGKGCYLLRTSTTALWFVETKSMGWRLYRYLDKPID